MTKGLWGPGVKYYGLNLEYFFEAYVLNTSSLMGGNILQDYRIFKKPVQVGGIRSLG